MPAITNLHVVTDPSTVLHRPSVVVIGRTNRLQAAELPLKLGVSHEAWSAMLSRTNGGDSGGSTVTWVGDRKVVLGVLPEACSRHNSPSRAWAIPGLAAQAGTATDAAVLLVLSDPSELEASVLAVARAFPIFQRSTAKDRNVDVAIAVLGAKVDVEHLQTRIDGVRLAAELVDMPTAELDTKAFVARARALSEQLGTDCKVIEDEALRDQGFGGLWGVGKAATKGPALVALSYRPAAAVRHVCWVGKGIVYDTGGLSIKGKTGMPGMKSDMGGAAAVLGAFVAAVREGVPYAITAVLCIAENAVGPEAFRPDDILVMKSGRTVEINNTDAEGRLVLADGVAWASAELDADLIVDMATLTGAQLMATGKVHAALYCNDEAVEQAAIVAGRAIGEPVHPLPYAPELYRKEFKSTVADMRNSVKDRANAQASCAGQFIANHLPHPAPRWLHVDIAGPAWSGSRRGTGYGVGLLLALGAGPEPELDEMTLS